MSWAREPEFLTREIIDLIHATQINTHGGRPGVRDENALESAIAAAQNVYHYADGDVYEVAAAYAYHLPESQAYLDGNKRTGVQAALVFMEAADIDTSRLPDQQTYDAMRRIAAHEMDRSGLADFLRATLAGSGGR